MYLFKCRSIVSEMLGSSASVRGLELAQLRWLGVSYLARTLPNKRPRLAGFHVHAYPTAYTENPADAQGCLDIVDRRTAIVGFAMVPQFALQPSRAKGKILEMNNAFTTINAAISAAAPLDTVLVPSGRYTERLQLDKAVTIAAAPGAVVEVVWETRRPYESAVVCTADGATIRGLTILHASPSIANNCAVQLLHCSACLDSCVITSSTGGGIIIEGELVSQLIDCVVQGCRRSGIGIYNDALEGSEKNTGAQIIRCKIQRNGEHGVLVRGGVAPCLRGNIIERNEGWGMVLQGCSGSYVGNIIRSNGKGAIAYDLLDVDTRQLTVDNFVSPLSDVRNTVVKQ